MKSLKIAICDDDQYMRNRIYELIKDYFLDKHMKVYYSYYNDGEDLLKNPEIYDIVILDIEMERIDGLKVKEKLFWERIPSKIIFLTDHDELKDEAFGKNVYGFVSKNNIKSIYKFLNIIVREYKSHCIVSIAGEEFDVYNITCIQGGRSYCHIYMNNQKETVVRKTLSEMEILLEKNTFIRVHRSYIVNVVHIHKCQNK